MVVPFGFGVGDFMAVGTLVLSLYKAFKNAPGEFNEISRELQSFYIVVADLMEQAEDENSLLNREGVSRKQELLALRDNLLGTMQELQDLHERYKRMGRISWSRFSLGQENLGAMRSKLVVEITAVNTFMSSLMLGALGRMEPMLRRIYQLLDERAKADVAIAQSILSARSRPGSDWAPLELLLKTEGIPTEYILENREEIKQVVKSVIEENHLEGNDSGVENISDDENSTAEDDSIYPEDSASNAPRKPGTKVRNQQRPLPKIVPTKPSVTYPTTTVAANPLRSRRSMPTEMWLNSLTPEEDEVRIQLMNHGYDIRSPVSRLQRLLLRSDYNEADALAWSIKSRNLLALKLLLDRGCNPNRGDAMYDTAVDGHWGAVRLLIGAGAKVEPPLLHLAARAGDSVRKKKSTKLIIIDYNLI